jgi:translation initiation factor IF-2
VAQDRRDKAREQTRNATPTATLANMFEQIEAGKATEMRVIVKCDVQGSLEALRKSLAPLGNAEVRLNVLHSGVGGITEGDVLLAEASTAMILGFRVVADQRARAMAETKGVEVRTYRVIYQLIEELEKALHGLLEPEITEKVLGRATIRELFKVSRVGTIAGCIVSDGIVNRNAKYRIIRDNVVVEDERSLDNLRRFKDDVRDVRAGMECGMKVSGFDDLKVGDILEAYQSVEVARK